MWDRTTTPKLPITIGLTGFPHRGTIDSVDWIILIYGGCLVSYRIFSSSVASTAQFQGHSLRYDNRFLPRQCQTWERRVAKSPTVEKSELRDYVECTKASFHANTITPWQSAECLVSDRVYKKRIFLELKVSSIG